MVESLFYIYRITKDPMYRQWRLEMFEAFREHEKLVDGVTGQFYAYTSLDTVMDNQINERKSRDNMESIWIAKTLKYFYVLFSDDSFFPLDSVVFNTEAHPMLKSEISGSKVFVTGWQRSTVPPPEPPPGRDGKIVRVDPDKKAVEAVDSQQPAIGIQHYHRHDKARE
ncbi:mannosyl-oligosaccharide alpha-1,2-mannosidase [Exophiala xenobiotica]|nr:mannosyl-oligosaccharide alpha-1,2-mannosidase [Exophiala xenobiotica]